MDTIRFEIGKREDPSDGLVDAVNIIVNDRNLVDILREVELLFRAQEAKPCLAGKYVGLPPEHVILPSPRLLGEPVMYYDYDSSQGKIPILGCGCGDVGCWPFWISIKLRDDVVIWDDFEQPHRRAWCYDEMRPFVFDRAQYLSALDRKPA